MCAAVRGVRDLRISRLTRLRRLIDQEHAIAMMEPGDPAQPVNPETGSPMANTPRVASPRSMYKAKKKAQKEKKSNTSIKVTNPMLAGSVASPMRGSTGGELEEDLLSGGA